MLCFACFDRLFEAGRRLNTGAASVGPFLSTLVSSNLKLVSNNHEGGQIVSLLVMGVTLLCGFALMGDPSVRICPDGGDPSVRICPDGGDPSVEICSDDAVPQLCHCIQQKGWCDPVLEMPLIAARLSYGLS